MRRGQQRLRRRHAEQMRDTVRGMVGTIAGMSLAEAVPLFVHAVIAAHLIDPQLHRVLEQEVPRPDPAYGREDLDTDLRATIRAVLHRPRGITAQTIEREISAAILRYLQGTA